MLNIIRKDDNAKVLVITPLLPGHKISKDTKRTIKRNDIPIAWVSYEGEDNIPTNVTKGMEEYEKVYKKLPKYILPLDRDITLGRNMIDRMYTAMEILPKNVAYVYANFEFSGEVNKKFPAQTFDINRLVLNNYISSNSLIKVEALKAVGGFVIDNKYQRLLDWAMYLKFFRYGYIGMPCPIASFVATSSPDDISAGSVEDFNIKRRRVIEDFVKPLVEKAKKEFEAEENTADNEGVLTFDL